MSQKTRKKSPKKTTGKAVRAAPMASAKTPAAKSRHTTAKKSDKKTGKRPEKASPKTIPRASHKVPSKPLRAPSLKKTTPRAVAKSATIAAADTVNPPARKATGTKAEASAVRKPALAEGAKAPGFRLPRDGGDTVSLADYSGKKLVLFFYPRADTPGCTKEAIDFTRLASAFAQSQTAVLGVSADSVKAQETFRNKHNLTIPLVSDERHEMLEAYGVWGEKSMYGKTFHGILRTTVLVGADGRIARIWRHVKVDGHADQVLAAARDL